MKKIILCLFCLIGLTALAEGYFKNLKEIAPDSKLSMKGEKEWYREAVFYHIWVKAFNDSNGDGVGDINGVTEKMDYLKELGINAIWLSPIFDCAFKGKTMHGYDTVDFYKINSKFGNEEDVDKMLTKAHQNGIRVIFDFVPNLTSDNHPWFTDAKKGGSKKDWYVWEKNPSQNWEKAWGGGSWEEVWNRYGDEYYYSAYYSGMPDLNFRNSEVRDEMANVVIYWLNRGFDGTRVDSARYLFENGPGQAADQKETHDYYKAITKEVINKYGDIGYGKMTVTESWTTFENIKEYYGNGKDEFSMAFDFPRVDRMTDAISMTSGASGKLVTDYIEEQNSSYPEGFCAATFLSNHDLAGSRPATIYKGNQEKEIAVAALHLFLSGTPFIYYGNEIGMRDGNYEDDMKMRTKMEWNKSCDSNIVLQKYKEFINIRKSRKSIMLGKFERVKCSNSKIFIFEREYKGEKTFVAINCSKNSENGKSKADYDNTKIIYGNGEKINIKSDNIEIKEMKPNEVIVWGN